MNKTDYKKLGKKGADKRWASRYAALRELSKYADNKNELDLIQKLKTRTLLFIIKTIEYIKSN